MGFGGVILSDVTRTCKDINLICNIQLDNIVRMFILVSLSSYTCKIVGCSLSETAYNQALISCTKCFMYAQYLLKVKHGNSCVLLVTVKNMGSIGGFLSQF